MSAMPTSGPILGQTFSLYFKNFGQYVVLCGIILAVPLGLQLYGVLSFSPEGEPAPFQSPTTSTAWLVGSLLGMIANYLAIAAMSYGVFQQVRNRSFSVGECIAKGLRRLVPVLIVAVVVGVLTFLGFLACIVPGLLVMVFLALAVPATVIEGTGPFQALSRSSQLGEGHRWTVFGVLFGLGIVAGVINVVISLTLAAISPMALFVSNAVLTVLWTGLQGTAVTLLYYHLRTSKESIDVDQIVEVFA